MHIINKDKTFTSEAEFSVGSVVEGHCSYGLDGNFEITHRKVHRRYLNHRGHVKKVTYLFKVEESQSEPTHS